jgi:hypothetical protein
MARRRKSEPPEIRDQLPRAEIVQTYRQQILERHEAGKKADEELKNALLNKIELTRQCGQLLNDAKGDLSEKEFHDASDFLGSDAVAAYIRFARLNSEPITDLRAAIRSVDIAMMASGLIEFPHRGPQQLHEPNFFSHAVRLLQFLLQDYRRYLHRRPLNEWPREQIEGFLSSLRPIIDLYRDLNLELKSRP